MREKLGIRHFSRFAKCLTLVLVAAGALLAIGSLDAPSAYSQGRLRERLREAVRERRQGRSAGRQSSSETSADANTMVVDGRQRTYLLHLPAGFDSARRYPLVLGFHGGGGQGEKFSNQTNLRVYADREGFIAVFPDGIAHHWSDGRGTTKSERQGVDDVNFVRTLVEYLQSTLPIDAARIYATGVSNGGMFSHRLACDMADVFAAVGPVVGSLATNYVPQCHPARPVSLVVIQGTEDPFIPIEGGDTKHKQTGSGAGGMVESAQRAMDFWASMNGCTQRRTDLLPPGVDDGTSVEQLSNTACREQTDVVYYIVHGMGHGWPPKGGETRLGGPTSHNIDATQVVWDFFETHPKSQATTLGHPSSQ